MDESGKSKLRYPSRSASKLKDQANNNNKSPEVASNSASMSSKRGRPPSVSKSVSVLELSSKDKSAKPPRRLSIQAKSTVSPLQKSASNVTPISEARAKRSANGRDNCDTPLSDVSRSSARRKFCVLTSASYWLNQIKLSESASKHSISLGFFKLALEAGCESLQRLRDELKSYRQRYDLAGFGETVESLFKSYEIYDALEQLPVSETCSHVTEDSTTPSGDDVQSASSTMGTRRFKPKSLNTDALVSSEKVSSKKESAQKTTASANVRASATRNPTKPKMVADNQIDNNKKKVQRQGKQEPRKGDDNIKKQGENAADREETVKPLDVEGALQGNKENLDEPLMEEATVTTEN